MTEKAKGEARTFWVPEKLPLSDALHDDTSAPGDLEALRDRIARGDDVDGGDGERNTPLM
jgi:hypothetical protein